MPELDIEAREYSGSIFIKITAGNYSDETLCSKEEALNFARKLVEAVSDINHQAE